MSAQPVSFGRYLLLDKIASGGMAEIFLAKATGEAGFQKVCVIKRVHPHLAANEGFVEMFLDEARIAARLTHPGIVQIFDLGREGGAYYFAMEYLAGEDLAAALRVASERRMRFPIDVALKIAASAAEALHYAHELKGAGGRPLGIVHRDVTPSNVFLTYQGSVKVLDFGIARAEERIQQTRVGVVKGKAPYMPPEQALGHVVDRRADIWALGVCLHEMLTGEPLFVGINRASMLEAVQKGRIPRPSELRPDLPAGVDEIVMGALERDPARRTQSGEAFRQGIERVLRDVTYVSATSQIGAFLRALFGPERAAKREELAGAISDPISSAPARASEARTASLDESVPTTEVGAPTRVDGPGRPSAPRRRRLGPALVLAGLTVGLAGFGLIAAVWKEPTRAAPLERPAPLPSPELPVHAAQPVPLPPPEPTTPQPGQPPPAPVPHAAGHAKLTTGWLSVDANEPVVASVDGARVGPAPVHRLKLSAGEHRLRLESGALGLNWTEKVTVRPGEELVRHETFRKGLLNVTVTPWADVFVDDVKLGQTPLVRQVWEGRHRLRLVGPSSEKSLSVEVSGDRPAVVTEHLDSR